eukprot:281380-Prorocentrum_minimum.AAC.2
MVCLGRLSRGAASLADCTCLSGSLARRSPLAPDGDADGRLVDRSNLPGSERFARLEADVDVLDVDPDPSLFGTGSGSLGFWVRVLEEGLEDVVLLMFRLERAARLAFVLEGSCTHSADWSDGPAESVDGSHRRAEEFLSRNACNRKPIMLSRQC